MNQIWKLAVRFRNFLIIGSGGLAINMVGLYLFTSLAGIYYVLSSFIAIELSLFFTFALNEGWTWRDRHSGSIWMRFIKYQMVNGVGLGINVGVLYLLTNFLQWHYMFSNLAGAGVATFWNFGVNHVFTWRLRAPG